jgi:hypothetical protein
MKFEVTWKKPCEVWPLRKTQVEVCELIESSGSGMVESMAIRPGIEMDYVAMELFRCQSPVLRFVVIRKHAYIGIHEDAR